MKKTSKSYESDIKPVWCPGCGNYGILKALKQAFTDLDINPEEIINVSGIGCSGRFSHYFNTYSLHGTHGRAVPTAVGAKAARPDMTVLAVGGDGDGLGIGGGHISHAARKNADITYILIDNRIYGLTKGQTSPTTPLDLKTKTSPYGVYDNPLNPIPIFLSYGVTFIARTAIIEYPRMLDILKRGIEHKGMAIVYILSPCTTFPILTVKQLKSIIKPLPDDHPLDQIIKSMELAYSEDPLYTGVFYQIERPSLENHLQNEIDKACTGTSGKGKLSIKELLKEYT